jgi:hypothetical protein
MSDEPTVAPTNDTGDESAPDLHSVENTDTTVKAIRDLLKDDDEGDLDAYDKIQRIASGTVKHAAWFKVIDTTTDLSYRVIVEPLDD